MRDNGPITNREVMMNDGEMLVSRTDAGGRIIFVNKAFIDISGFTEEELLGSPHNLVRHPHMPKEAFADLWQTIKAGKPWEGFVKNRTRNGDHYWVRANVTPVTENGQITGFVSIRSKPSREQVAAAERLYTDLREGRANGMVIKEGRVIRTGLAGAIAHARNSVTGLMVLAMSVPVILTIAAAELINLNMDTAGIGVIIAALVAAVGLGRALIGRINAPLNRMEGHFDALARGDFAHDITDEPVSEYQRLTALLRATKAKLGYSQLEKVEMDRQSEIHRRQALERVATSLEGRVNGIVQQIQDSSESLLGNSQTLSGNADQTMVQAGSVTSMTGQVTANVQAVSAATQELSSSVDEISRQVAHAATISREAVEQAEHTNRMVLSLSDAASRIGEVIGLINTIASQTNLLALNATIEAARAGEAGKGFAVVAGEVKSLANQTAKATQEIGQQIAAIQGETRQAVDAIQGITSTIETINELSSAIAAAVEEQGAATSEIARSVAQAAAGTSAAADNVAVVANAAQETKVMADQVYGSADGLKTVSRQLAGEVTAFLSEIRAA
ncbi:PAS [Magnetospirillum sp. LM-5]|uniref:methyl-accepting chemotaxis protein n=1 Tax=Magnetospirillum sp. LM-5 TaxID=2681466 RepID=UPI001381AF75|nr:PAS domain-containing methyl-accepting chemotaxis protein [Magnetospirillum sp. LM-5]CAA7612657.1 PAS [Magnetospirillum sp. LM-5]